MIDYARVAETLKELKEFYTQPLTPDLECWRVHKTLTAAAALCEAHAAPVDEAKERAEFEKWFREHYDIPLIRNSRAEAAWFARARSDARAKVAEAECERLRKLLHQCLAVLRYPDNGALHCRGCRAGADNQWQHEDYCTINNQCLAVDAVRDAIREALPPPPTVEGERG